MQLVLLLLALLCTFSASPCWSENDTSLSTRVLSHQGREREYLLYVPTQIPQTTRAPLVLFIHGGGGNAQQASRMGMSLVAKKHGFLVAYPNALDKHWNDGRESKYFREHDSSVDDAGFLLEVVKNIQLLRGVDSERVFAAGPSNGGFMSQRLAVEHSEKFAGIAVLIATMGEALSKKFSPREPVSVLYINGTEDPAVPYNGGHVRVNLFPRLNQLLGRTPESRGKVLGTEEATELWVTRNRTVASPRITRLPNMDTEDGSEVEYFLWNGGDRGTAVGLYKIHGGGHTIPGGKQYFRPEVIGRLNNDFDGLEAVWQFFAEYGRK